MRSNSFRIVSAGAVILLTMMACNISSFAATPTAQPTSTATEPADTSTPEPPTDTPTPAETATITLTPEPSLTPTVEVPVAEVQREVNCRKGPGGMYDLVVVFKAGDTVEIVARDLGGGFVFVKNPNEEGGCWMLENSLKVSGDLTPLPAFTPPPTPTLAPSFTVAYKKLDKCGDVFVRFVVTNTGGFGFRSAYVKVTNLKNSEVTEKVTNTFDLTIDCVVAQSIGNVTPGGGTAYLESDSFKKDPSGQKMRAVFQLCTEQNLKGACSTAVLEFVGK